MKKIDISTPTYPNTFVLVDDCDYDSLSKYRWHAHKETSGRIYAKRAFRVDGKQKELRMHVAILGKIKGKQIDHRNDDTLDNQRHNLRHCTQAENQRNRGAQCNNKSGYKGVCWRKRSSRWIAQINVDGEKLYLGCFTCLVKAAKAYDEAAIKYFKEFAYLNFPKEHENAQ